MKIIVGLGNPGRKYDATPHNLGFEVADRLCRRWGGSFRLCSREQAEVAEVRIGAEPALLVRPVTWMNLSGQAVREIIRNRPVEFSDVVVISDDVNLDCGRLRIRADGSHGGHNGLRSIIECLGSDQFPRIRIGCHPSREIDDLARYVLSVPPPEEKAVLAQMMDVAADAAELWMREGAQAAANKFNGARIP